MRPAGEVRIALLAAARQLTTAERAPTVVELATHAQVGFAAAMHTVRNMRRAGHLCIVRERRVSYRNRPVAEYAPANPNNNMAGAADNVEALRQVLATWCAQAEI